GKRHELDRGDAVLGEMAELRNRRAIRTLGREGADVQLVDHRLAPRAAAPARGLPRVAARIDHLARPVDIARLEARRRIGHELPAVDAVLIQRAGAGIALDELVPAARGALHAPRAAADDDVHGLGSRRPKPETHAALREHCGAEGHGVAADQRFLRGHQRSSSSAAHSRPPRPKASASANTTPASRMRKVWRTMSPPTFTWSSAISTTKARIA